MNDCGVVWLKTFEKQSFKNDAMNATSNHEGFRSSLSVCRRYYFFLRNKAFEKPRHVTSVVTR